MVESSHDEQALLVPAAQLGCMRKVQVLEFLVVEEHQVAQVESGAARLILAWMMKNAESENIVVVVAVVVGYDGRWLHALDSGLEATWHLHAQVDALAPPRSADGDRVLSGGLCS